MGHSRTPTQNTAGDGFPADPIDGYERASIRASPDKSPTRRLVIEATYDLQGHRPSMQCAACTIDLTTAGKGYAATGRQTPRPGTGRHHHPPGRPAAGADTGAEELEGLCAHHRSAQTARHQAVAACATCPDAGGRSGGVADAGGSVSEAMHAVSRRRI